MNETTIATTELKSETLLEITGDSVTVKTLLTELIRALRAWPVQNRERSLAITKLQEAKSWMIESGAVEP